MSEYTQIKKRSICISGHATSITIEDEFWIELKKISKEERVSINILISEIDKNNSGNLSSAIRLYILDNLKQKLTQQVLQ